MTTNPEILAPKTKQGMHFVHCSVVHFRTSSYAGGHRSGIAIHNPKDLSPKSLKLHLYDDGFKLETSEFVRLTVPERVAFLSSLRSGEVPVQLRPLIPLGVSDIPVELIEVKGAFSESNQAEASSVNSDPRATLKPVALYSGEGVSLSGSSLVNPVVSLSGIPHPTVDPGSASSQIQIRLPDGNRVTRKFNDSSLGSVLQQAICSGLTGVAISTIVISTGFPPRRISPADLAEKTIKDLGLSNSVVKVSISIS